MIIFPMQRDIGSIENGKLEDLIVLDQNPLLNIRHTSTIRYVMKNGELFERATLDQVGGSVEDRETVLVGSGGEASIRRCCAIRGSFHQDQA